MDSSIFDFQFIDTKGFLEFFIRFVFDLLVIIIVAGGIYFRFRKRRNILFALYLINLIVFFVCYLLQSVQLSIGFAFGIFAIFSILRYRTTTVPIKEMTYIFIALSLAIVNALTNIQTGYAIMIFTNFVIVFFTYLLEKKFIKSESQKTIVYDKIDLIKPQDQATLLNELKEKLGLNIHRIEIGRIDFKRQTVRIKLYYFDDLNSSFNDDETLDD